MPTYDGSGMITEAELSTLGNNRRVIDLPLEQGALREDLFSTISTKIWKYICSYICGNCISGRILLTETLKLSLLKKIKQYKKQLVISGRNRRIPTLWNAYRFQIQISGCRNIIWKKERGFTYINSLTFAKMARPTKTFNIPITPLSSLTWKESIILIIQSAIFDLKRI